MDLTYVRHEAAPGLHVRVELRGKLLLLRRLPDDVQADGDVVLSVRLRALLADQRELEVVRAGAECEECLQLPGHAEDAHALALASTLRCACLGEVRVVVDRDGEVAGWDWRVLWKE